MSFPHDLRSVAATVAAQAGSGKAWSDLTYAVNGNDSNGAAVNNLGPAAVSQTLKLTGFDMTWFDSTSLDMTGVTLFLYCSGMDPAKIEFQSVQLADDTGTAYGTNYATVANSFISAGNVFIASIQIPGIVLPAVFSSANFGVHLSVVNNSTGTKSGGKIRLCEVVPTFTRKETIGTHGVAFYDASGVLKSTLAATVPRVVYNLHQSAGFLGNISLPDFDDTRGVLIATANFVKARSSPAGQLPASYTWDVSEVTLFTHSLELPNYIWDNVTKILTVTSGALYPSLPSGFELSVDLSCPWTLTAVHYR